MRCPNDIEITEDWQRSKRGQPMFYASHIADCETCKQKIAELELFNRELYLIGESDAHDHIEPEIQAAYAENKLTGKQRKQVEEHLSNCSECRISVAGLVEALNEVKPQKACKWIGLIAKAAYSAAGALAVLIVVFISPIGFQKETEMHPEATVIGIKGNDSIVISALRMIEPSNSDLDLAIAVWMRVLENNPKDTAAKIKLSQLKERKAKLTEKKR